MRHLLVCQIVTDITPPGCGLYAVVSDRAGTIYFGQLWEHWKLYS
jgi:hypothetical protein